MNHQKRFRVPLVNQAEKGRKIPVFFVLKNMSLASVIIALMVVVPMMMVWKQVYITAISKRYDTLRDSVAGLQKEIAVLNMNVEQLSRTERIEKIARESFGLEYPSSKEIVIVRSGSREVERKSFLDSRFWMVVRKSLTAKKG
jgi:cell division protein FtsL